MSTVERRNELVGRLRFVTSISAATAGLDLVSKSLVEVSLSGGVPLALTSFMNLRLGFNPGISYGLFPMTSTSGVAVLLGVQTIIITAMLIFAARSGSSWEQGALGLIIGGAVGNVVDRARDGFVTDFLDLHVQGWHWPTFNVADVAITLGAGLLLWNTLRPLD
ncbi:MAG: signal peptidase II, partial [Pirellulaceae bacterium]